MSSIDFVKYKSRSVSIAIDTKCCTFCERLRMFRRDTYSELQDNHDGGCLCKRLWIVRIPIMDIQCNQHILKHM